MKSLVLSLECSLRWFVVATTYTVALAVDAAKTSGKEVRRGLCTRQKGCLALPVVLVSYPTLIRAFLWLSLGWGWFDLNFCGSVARIGAVGGWLSGARSVLP